MFQEYFGSENPLKKVIIGGMLKRLKKWDLASNKRIDYFIAISDNVKNRIRDFYGMGAASAASMIGRQTITMTMNFHHRDGFDRFAKDLFLLEEAKDEEYLRRHNPTLQHAYEEYQLLLKLSK
jgi:hypothetical protein